MAVVRGEKGVNKLNPKRLFSNNCVVVIQVAVFQLSTDAMKDSHKMEIIVVLSRCSSLRAINVPNLVPDILT